MAERIATRLYLADPLAAGSSVALGPAAAHRLRDVLRLGPGAAVAAFNPQDGEWLCRIAEMTRGRATLAIEAQRRPPADEPDLWLLFAPIRRARLDWLVEKATELGVAALIPVATARTQAPQVNREHLAAVAIAAAEQCERLSVPEVRSAEPLDRVLALWPVDRRLIVCDESGGGRPIAEALAGWPPGAPAALLVGPEGGFAEWELDALGKLPIVTRVGLGPRVLRAETAAVAALAAFQAIAGDWRRARER
ncbi:MAG TPA: 16S rRNA (uracil(1498)-N(3))-methyltransferase [Stellaceae bacterium]|nr:16S rRNA (uracil(1498)-N(3))-methyltransferase [Stellaceae bacterium]